MKEPAQRVRTIATWAFLFDGPVQQQSASAMLAEIARYALCGDRPLSTELVGPVYIVGPLRVIVEPAPGTHAGDLQLVLEVACP